MTTTFQDYVIEATTLAAQEFFRYAKAVPADKVEWKPLDAGRSVLDIAREIAKCPEWGVEVIADDWKPEFDEAAMAAMKAEMDSWTTVEECEKQFLQRFEAFAAKVKEFPSERLKATRWLPFGGGRDYTFAEMLEYPRWNCNYHTGQVAYIQVLFGDKEMY